MLKIALGQCPSEGPGGLPYKHALSGKSLGYTAAICEFKGDWKVMNELIGLPSWKEKQGICWRCNCTLEQVADVNDDAMWRQPANRISHGDLLLKLQRKGRLCKIFDMPAFDSSLFRVDWLHAADLGVTANFFGAVLHLCISLPFFGPNQAARLAFVWSCGSEAARCPLVKENQLKVLPLKRFKHIRSKPCLKASGGQIRALAPWFLKFANSWQIQDMGEAFIPELELAKGAIADLAKCYDTLSSHYGPTALPDLKQFSISFAEKLVALAEIKGGRYSLPPKLHMWLELCAEGCTPSKGWNYGEEDFGGSVASMARRRGGKESPLATSKNTLLAFMAKQPLPTLKGRASSPSSSPARPVS